MRIVRVATLVAASLAFGDAAGATTLQTSHVGATNGQVLVCLVSNVGRRTVSVEVDVFDTSGAAITPVGDSCNPTPLGAGETCQVQLSTNTPGRFVVKSRGKIRANVTVFGPNPFPVITVVEATK